MDLQTNISRPLSLSVAGIRFPLSLDFPESAGLLGGYVDEIFSDGQPIAMTVADWALWHAMGQKPCAYGEYSILPMRVSDRLMAHDRFILHSAAFRWRDKAWLICAGSGVGKTTQLKTLLTLYPDEIGVINGDRPVLEIRPDAPAFVHPSPWNGKEGLYGTQGAPLGGIVILRRGDKNTMERLSERKAAPMIYMSVFQCYESEASIRRSAFLVERLLAGMPIWRLTNKGVPDSTRLMYDTLREEAERHDL